jgi:hydrogenase maturation protein HypF
MVRQRREILCRGVVQGVGFRPAVHRLATSLGLTGWVRNGPDGVAIQVEGEQAALDRFLVLLPRSLPPLARLDEFLSKSLEPEGDAGFSIFASEEGARLRALVPPDSALCSDCRNDMEREGDRRYRYPFTTCTNCGPRFSLVRALPYDRERTAMACFPLCEDCRREYGDPADRRFHAEPVCCPSCGPRLWLSDGEGRELAEGADAIGVAQAALAGGKIVAIKALGGFQLACRADLAEPVAELRRRKRRPAKPFALMVRDLDAAHRLVALDERSASLLRSPQAPVVLAPAKADAPVDAGIAPGVGDLGVMLPTAPLHVELFRGAAFDSLVMTSGNLSDEPIARGNREALARLGGIADLFLLHDRDVVRRVDDSVARSSAEGSFLLRRARGCTPEALPLPVEAPEPVLALGAYLQTTACVAVGREAFPSQHVGDLEGDPARAFLREVTAGLEDFLQVRPRRLVVDAHPDYASTWLGEELERARDGQLLRVQHHVAHAAAVLAEHGLFPEIGSEAGAVVLDGTGWGPDGTAWGGEWLTLRGDLSWEREARIVPIPLVGGESAVSEPWRVLAAALASRGEAGLLPSLPAAKLVSPEKLESVSRLALQGTWPLASGAGRVFEAAGALLGLAAVNSYEGEAAARLEALAALAPEATLWPEAKECLGARELDGALLLVLAARRFLRGEATEAVAAGFHATFCELAAALARRVFGGRVRTVALGGGCFVNRLLRAGLSARLRSMGYNPVLPARVPPGDGGLSYGQAVLGAVAAARGAAHLLGGS